MLTAAQVAALDTHALARWVHLEATTPELEAMRDAPELTPRARRVIAAMLGDVTAYLAAKPEPAFPSVGAMPPEELRAR